MQQFIVSYSQAWVNLRENYVPTRICELDNSLNSTEDITQFWFWQ